MIGVEGDWQSLDLKASTCQVTTLGTNPCVYGPRNINNQGIVTTSASTTALGSIRGRFGLTFDDVMLYGTGGVAFADVTSTLGLSCANAGCGSDGFTFASTTSTSSVKSGWVAGAGVEWRVIGNWLARAEYLHYDVGSISNNIVGQGTCACTASSTQSFRYDIVRAGLSYKFGY